MQWYDEAVATGSEAPYADVEAIGLEVSPPADSKPPATPPGAEPLPSVAANAATGAAAPAAAQAPRPRRTVPRPSEEADFGDPNEVELRARASLLAVDQVCSAAELLRSGQDPRTRALARELRARCSRTGR